MNAIPETTAPKADHAHRWRIDEPNGPTSAGVCRICGAHKGFKNWMESGDFTTNTEHQLAA